jgi:hypothetical protein
MFTMIKLLLFGIVLNLSICKISKIENRRDSELTNFVLSKLLVQNLNSHQIRSILSYIKKNKDTEMENPLKVFGIGKKSVNRMLISPDVKKEMLNGAVTTLGTLISVPIIESALTGIYRRIFNDELSQKHAAKTKELQVYKDQNQIMREKLTESLEDSKKRLTELMLDMKNKIELLENAETEEDMEEQREEAEKLKKKLDDEEFENELLKAKNKKFGLENHHDKDKENHVNTPEDDLHKKTNEGDFDKKIKKSLMLKAKNKKFGLENHHDKDKENHVNKPEDNLHNKTNEGDFDKKIKKSLI